MTFRKTENNSCKIKALIAVLCIVVGTVVLDTSWKFYLEDFTRGQARNTLEKVRLCLDDYPVEGVDVVDRLSFCANGVTTTRTGDMFAYSIKTKAFTFDPSLDCYVEGGKTMTPDSICTIFNDPLSCAAALKQMDSGYPSDKTSRVKWLFDDSYEWIEWIIYPKNSESRVGKEVPDQIVIALGTQTDELYEQFTSFKIIIRCLGAFAIIFTLVNIYFRKEED